MAKTIDLIKRLPIKLQIPVTMYVKDTYNDGGAIPVLEDENLFHDESEVLYMGFDWENTIEGFGFWAQEYMRLKGGKKSFKQKITNWFKSLFVFMALATLFSCRDVPLHEEKEDINSDHGIKWELASYYDLTSIYLITIDSIQYVVVRRGEGISISVHKSLKNEKNKAFKNE